MELITIALVDVDVMVRMQYELEKVTVVGTHWGL